MHLLYRPILFQKKNLPNVTEVTICDNWNSISTAVYGKTVVASTREKIFILCNRIFITKFVRIARGPYRVPHASK